MSFLEENRNAIMALTLLGVLYLVWVQSGYSVSSPEGFAGDSGASMRFEGGNRRTDAAGSVTKGLYEGLGSAEPPVFWNSGEFSQIRDYQRATVGDAALNEYDVGLGPLMRPTNPAPVPVTVAEGMGLYGRKAPAYEGMQNDRFSDSSLQGSAVGL